MSNEPNDKLLNELQEQNKDFATAYWDIFDNKEAVPENQRESMRAELLKNYKRAVALLDGQAGLEKDREIAELEEERLKIEEEASLRNAEIKAVYRLKHVELTAKTDAQAARIKKEFEIKQTAEEQSLEIKKAQIVPVKEELPQRWWRRLFRRPVRYRTNYAYDLASQKADLEACKEFAARENEILKLEAEQSDMDELQLAVKKVITDCTGNKTKGRKAKIVNEALSEIIGPLCEMFTRRERALTELVELLSENNNNAFNEPSDQAEESNALKIESEREELQTRAMTLLSAFCLKRIDDIQQGLNKPKRQRKRKLRPGIEGEEK